MKRLLLVDGGIFHRWHPHLKDRAPRILVEKIELLARKFKCEMIRLAADSIGPTFRKKLCPNYKSGRSEKTEEFREHQGQFNQLCDNRAWLEIMEGFEADDVIGTMAAQATEKGYQTIIVSTDGDLNQCLVNRSVNRLTSFKVDRGELYNVDWMTESKLIQNRKVKPSQWAGMRAIAGDSSDNIKGVAGIAEKTATNIIRAFGTLESAIKNIDNPENWPVMSRKQQENFTDWVHSERWKIDYELTLIKRLDESFF